MVRVITAFSVRSALREARLGSTKRVRAQPCYKGILVQKISDVENIMFPVIRPSYPTGNAR